MRIVVKVLVALFAVHTVACAAPVATGNEGGNGSGSHGGFGSAETANGGAGGGATCDDACGHYLECKGADNATNRQKCDSMCKQAGVTAQQIADYMKTDCQTAIAMIDNPQGPQQQGGSKSSQCNGCVNDGTGCNWYSQSDWGQGPYSGAAMSCDPSCCQ